MKAKGTYTVKDQKVDSSHPKLMTFTKRGSQLTLHPVVVDAGGVKTEQMALKSIETKKGTMLHITDAMAQCFKVLALSSGLTLLINKSSDAKGRDYVDVYLAGSNHTYDFDHTLTDKHLKKYPAGQLIAEAKRNDPYPAIGGHGPASMVGASPDTDKIMSKNKFERTIDMMFNMKMSSAVPEWLSKIETNVMEQQAKRSIVEDLEAQVNLFGYSRGGAATFWVGNEVAASSNIRGKKSVNMFALDPVPGDASLHKEQTYIPSCTNECIVLIAKHERKMGFSPMLPDGLNVIPIPVPGNHATLAGSIVGPEAVANDTYKSTLFSQIFLVYKRKQWNGHQPPEELKHDLLSIYLDMIKADENQEYEPLKKVTRMGGLFVDPSGDRRVWEGNKKSRTLKDLPCMTYREGKLALIGSLDLKSLEAFNQTLDTDFLEGYSREAFTQWLSSHGQLNKLFSGDVSSSMARLESLLSDENIEQTVSEFAKGQEQEIDTFLRPVLGQLDQPAIQSHLAQVQGELTHGSVDQRKKHALVFEKKLMMESLGQFVKDKHVSGNTWQQLADLESLRAKFMHALWNKVTSGKALVS